MGVGGWEFCVLPLTVCGDGAGLVLLSSALIRRAITVALFGVNPLDPVIYGLTSLALFLAAAVASCVPALRATRTNAVVALRSE